MPTIKRLSLAVMLSALVVTSAACAKAHKITTVTSLSAHQTIALVQDTADAVTCGAPTAPVPCLPDDVRKGVISDYLKQALQTDIALLTAVRNWPGPPTKLEIVQYLADINRLLSNVINTLPEGAAKTRLLSLMGGAK